MAAENIFQQYQGPLRSVADYRGDMDKQEQNMLTLAAARLQAQQGQQAMADDQAYRKAAMSSGGDTNKLVQVLNSMGMAKKAQEIQQYGLANAKTQADTSLSNAHAGKFGADTDAANYELRMKKHDQAVKDIAGFQTPQQAADNLKAHMQAGDVDPVKGQAMLQSIPQDPAQFASWQLGMLKNIMAAKDQVGLQVPDANNVNTNNTSAANNKLTNATSLSNNAATVGATMRGQNMTDARSREATSATMSKPFEVTGADGQPVLVQQNKNGQITPVQGYAPKTVAEKPLTEGQSKAALFGSRMQESDRILGDLAKSGSTTSTPGMGAGFGVGAVVNALSSAPQQQLMQAKRDFVNAVLRRESGASIAASEFDNAEKQYFPQQGDTPGVIAQKANNRAIAIRGMQAEIPKAQRGIVGEIIGKDAQPPSGIAEAVAAEMARRAKVQK
jgi:hypothetical protein